MSTELGLIKGRSEQIIRVNQGKKIGYVPNSIVVTRIFAGKKLGPLVQLSTDEDHIQLDKKQATALMFALGEFINS